MYLTILSFKTKFRDINIIPGFFFFFLSFFFFKKLPTFIGFSNWGDALISAVCQDIYSQSPWQDTFESYFTMSCHFNNHSFIHSFIHSVLNRAHTNVVICHIERNNLRFGSGTTVICMFLLLLFLFSSWGLKLSVNWSTGSLELTAKCLF